MNLLKAITKCIAREINSVSYSKNKNKAFKSARKETGKILRKANKNGKYINGSTEFRKRYNSKIKKLNKKNKIISNFINDL